MPSKGIDVFTWIALEGWKVEYNVPNHGVTHDGFRDWRRDHLEVDSKDIKGFHVTGDFSFTIRDGGNNQVLRKTNRINAMTGSAEHGEFDTLPNQQSLVRDDCVVTFGFYDSGPGIAQLPKHHMCWVTVTPNWSRWMGDIASQGSPQAGKPFTTFVLPSAHDVGMNSLDNVKNLLHNSPDIAPIIGNWITNLGLGELIAKSNISSIITALAITQKDTVPTMLKTGARYFEFRPAHMSAMFEKVNKMDDRLYFQHAMIPGLDFGHFLDQVIDFLVESPSEIVVVQIRFDGVHDTCRRANDDEINGYIGAALGSRNNEVERGGFDDMKQSINALRDQRKRLIILTNAGQASTYSDVANATLDGISIAGTFPTFIQGAATLPPDNQMCLWQCQATATNIRDVVIYSVVASNDCTSPLLCTKPICDQVTLPWLRAHGNEMPDTTLQAIMNDFFDGATADVAIELSRRYLDRQ